MAMNTMSSFYVRIQGPFWMNTANSNSNADEYCLGNIYILRRRNSFALGLLDTVFSQIATGFEQKMWRCYVYTGCSTYTHTHTHTHTHTWGFLLIQCIAQTQYSVFPSVCMSVNRSVVERLRPHSLPIFTKFDTRLKNVVASTPIVCETNRK